MYSVNKKKLKLLCPSRLLKTVRNKNVDGVWLAYMLWDPPLVIYVYQEHLDENCIKKGIKIENEKKQTNKKQENNTRSKGRNRHLSN